MDRNNSNDFSEEAEQEQKLPGSEQSDTNTATSGSGSADADDQERISKEDVQQDTKADAPEDSKGDIEGDADGQSLDDDGSECARAEDSDPLTAMENEIAAERDRYLRLAAEYDNYRKRSAKERENTYQDAQADLITKLLPVYDNLERALKAQCEDEAFYKGVELTMTLLTEILENIGLVPIPAVGELFDPNRHNAVMTIQSPEFGEKTVAEEYQKGFMLGDKVIRHSTVVVAN